MHTKPITFRNPGVDVDAALNSVIDQYPAAGRWDICYLSPSPARQLISPLHLRMRRKSGCMHNRRRHINQTLQIITLLPHRDFARPPDNKRHTNGSIIVASALGSQEMIPHVIAVIRGIDDERVLREPEFIECVQDPAEMLV